MNLDKSLVICDLLRLDFKPILMAFKSPLISFVNENSIGNVAIPINTKQSMMVIMVASSMYSIVHATVYPIGVFVSNGNLLKNILE